MYGSKSERSLDMLRRILDHIPVMISCFDAVGQLTYANREWQRVIGWTLEEAQQIDILAGMYPDPVVRAPGLDLIKWGEPRWVDFQIRSRDGRMIEAAWARFAHADGSSMRFAVDVTERRLCEKARGELDAQFGTLFKVGPVPLAVSTIADGRIVDVNNRWVELFGYRREEVIGRTEIDLDLLVDPATRARARDIAQADGLVRDFQVQVRLKSGQVRDLLVSAVPVELPGEPPTWISTQLDITDRKSVDAERTRLLESQIESRAVAEAALQRLRVIHTITDVALSYLDVDDLLRELLKRLRRALRVEIASVHLIDAARQELFVRAIDGVPLESVASIGIPLDAVNLHAPSMTNVQAPQLGRDDWFAKIWAAMNMPLRAAMSVPLVVDGTAIGIVGVTSTRTPFIDDDLFLLQVVAERVTPAIERALLGETVRASHDRLEVMSRRLLTAGEEERRRVAVELHDDLGQLLTAAKINVQSAERQAAASPAQLGEAITCIDQALQRVRDLALDLRPSVLDDLGLAAALRWFVDRFARAHLQTHLSVDELPRLDSTLETTCFRLAQETLTNIVRHAQARHVWLDLHRFGDTLQIRIRDDGIGYDVAAARAHATSGASLGLLGMEERVALMHGTLKIVSEPGSGTEVSACFSIAVRPPAAP
jgi:PAS domain S-box-containing protein